MPKLIKKSEVPDSIDPTFYRIILNQEELPPFDIDPIIRIYAFKYRKKKDKVVGYFCECNNPECKSHDVRQVFYIQRKVSLKREGSGRFCSKECVARHTVLFSRFDEERHPGFGKKRPREVVERIRASQKGRKVSEEQKAKLRESALKRFANGENHPWHGRKHSEESRRKMSRTTKRQYAEGTMRSPTEGRRHSAETRRKISEAGKRGYAEGSRVPPNLGKTMSPESRRKLSESVKRSFANGRSKEALRWERYGSDNPNWKGGLSVKPYPPEFNKKLKRKIKNRDIGVCQKCGRSDLKLVCHHIDYDKENNAPINLITICWSCHGKTLSNREYWTDFYKTFLEQRKVWEEAT